MEEHRDSIDRQKMSFALLKQKTKFTFYLLLLFFVLYTFLFSTPIFFYYVHGNYWDMN